MDKCPVLSKEKDHLGRISGGGQSWVLSLLAHYPSSLGCEKGSGGWLWNMLQEHLEEGREQCSFKPSMSSGNLTCLLEFRKHWHLGLTLAWESLMQWLQCVCRAAWWRLCMRMDHPQGLPWQLSGYSSTVALLGPWVRFLVGELTACTAKK